MRFTGKRAWLLRVLLATIVPLGTLEAVLQAGAWILSTRSVRQESANPESGERTVLCVGDSYTWGVGSSGPEQSYPGQLEARLRAATGETWSVRNGGWPGRNSADVLRELPAQLDRFHPKFVCVLAGTNDSWSHPKLHARTNSESEATGAGFRWEWRTPRLLKLLRHEVRATEPAASAPSILGVWIFNGSVCRFDPDGRCYYDASERRWSLDGATLTLTAADGSRLDLLWKGTAGRLVLECSAPPTKFVLKRWHRPPNLTSSLPSPESAVGRDAQQALSNQNYSRAAELFQQALVESPDVALLHLGSALSLAQLGRTREAEQQLAWLLARFEREPNQALAEACMAAQTIVAPGNRSVELLRRLATSFPDDVDIHASLSLEAIGIGDTATARAAIERALALVPDTDPILQSELHLIRAQILRRFDPAESLRSSWLVYRLSGDRNAALGALRLLRAFQGPKWNATAAVKALGLDDDAMAALNALMNEAAGADDSVQTVMESHLEQMRELCVKHDARVVLVNYPFNSSDHLPVFRRLAAQGTWIVAPVNDEFNRVLQTRQRDDLFVPDGHCNDAGYAIVAAVVGDALLRSIE